MRINKYYLIMVSFFIILIACEKDKADTEVEPVSNNCDTIAEVSFQTHIQPLLNNECNTSGCHGDAVSVEFSNYSTVKSYVDNGQLEQRVLIDKTMPPSQPLGVCDQNLLQDWIDNGAPNN